MMLNKLDAKTVRLMKSGQLVTEVSAVIKELIENSLDAGANNVQLLISQDFNSIELKDNGSFVL
jgi:DNA mismatch repair protein PMS2